MPTPPRKPSRPPTIGARLILTFFALILVAGGALLVYGLLRSYRTADSMDQWVEVSAVIDQSYIEEERPDLSSPPKFRPVLQYGYIHNSERYDKGHKIRRGEMDNAKSSQKEAQEVIDQYKQGMSVRCYVNPANPNEAVLQKEPKRALYAIWFPALIAVGGMGMIIGAWWPRKTDEDEDEDDDAEDGTEAASETDSKSPEDASSRSGTQSATGGGGGE